MKLIKTLIDYREKEEKRNLKIVTFNSQLVIFNTQHEEWGREQQELKINMKLSHEILIKKININ